MRIEGNLAFDPFTKRITDMMVTPPQFLHKLDFLSSKSARRGRYSNQSSEESFAQVASYRPISLLYTRGLQTTTRGPTPAQNANPMRIYLSELEHPNNRHIWLKLRSSLALAASITFPRTHQEVEKKITVARTEVEWRISWNDP
ncbi:hypothetical protein Trydic_g20233 [Trypoxylus dichotomus]